MESHPITSLAPPTGLTPPQPAAAVHPVTPHVDVLDAIDVVVFVLSRAASIEFIGSAWERLSGFTPGLVHGNSLLDYVHPGDHGKVTRGLEDSRTQPVCLVARWLTKDGNCLRLEMRARMRVGSAGERAGFVGTLTDVTRQSQAADVRQASHRTVETLINNLPGMVYRCRNNRNWTMEYVSHGARELTGWQPEDFVNNTRVAFASLIVEADRQAVWDTVQVCLRENRPFELVYRIRTALQVDKWVLERGQGNYSTSGELLSLEGFITDITDEKCAELRGQRDALYDASTGLPMPALLLDRVGQAIARARLDRPTESSVLAIYLDRFARIRRQLGKDIGDRISLAIGRRLQCALGPADSLCRRSEDEFVALVDDAGETLKVVSRLQDCLRDAIQDGELEIYLTASIGVAMRCATYSDADEVLAEALAAMSRARDLGGDRTELVGSDIEAQQASM